MNKILILFYLLFFTTLVFSDVEISLQSACSKLDLKACENLTTLYISRGKWENAYLLGDTLCKKDILKGCTFAGTALLGQGKSREGLAVLMRACDEFEPFACRSLSRLMKQNREGVLSYMYAKRACYYGLNESCKNLNKPKSLYSSHGLRFLKEVYSDCDDTNSVSCHEQLVALEKCQAPLLRQDCLLMQGELSIFFRAKLLQSGAKLSLVSLVASEKILKENPKINHFSYDLDFVLQNRKPLSSYQYVFGFMKTCTKKYEKGQDVQSTSLALYKDSYSELSKRVKSNISAFFYKGKADDCYDPSAAFEAFAVANLDPLNPARLDIWKTNRDGDFINVQNGLPLP